MPDVRATTLIGLTLSDGTDIIANDTVLAALGKLQAHLTMTDAGLATEVEARTNADIIAFSIDPSTFIVTLTRGNGMLYESEIPYSSESQPGVITAQMYNQVINNAGSIDAMRNGLWVRGFLGQNPNQTTLTNIWLSIMGGTEVPVGARVTNEDENVPNGKDYFYTSTATGNSWVPKSVVAIPLFTNLYAGIIQGSLLDGEVSATSFGTGRVSGWDTLKTRVSTLESTKVNKTATIAISGPDVSAASVAIEDGAILQSVLSDTGIAAGDYGDTTRTIEDGGTFSILQVTVDSKGRLSSVLPHTMTLTHARNGILTGLVTTDASYVTQTDSILAAIGKHEARIIINAADITTKEPNIALGLEYQYWDGTKTWRSFNSSVRAALLTGLTIPVSAEIVATDNVLAAFGKTQAHLTALDTAVAGKEPSIALGTATQYWRGDKTWQVLENDVRATELIGFSLTALDDVVATDSVIGAFGKLQAQINRADADVSGKEPIIAAGTVTQYWRGDKGWHELNPAVIASVLTGYAATNAAIAATDTIVAAFGKAQGQINSKQPQLNGTGFVKASGTAISYDNSTYATTAALSTAIANAAALKFENLIVDMSAWSDDTEFPDYPFAANVPTANVTAAMYPEVVFNPADAANFAPVAASQAGSVRIFAAEQPTAAITILTIVLTR
jgi:hypothetical protein